MRSLERNKHNRNNEIIIQEKTNLTKNDKYSADKANSWQTMQKQQMVYTAVAVERVVSLRDFIWSYAEVS